MLVTYGDGLVAFRVDDDSAAAKVATRNEIRAQYKRNFDWLSDEQIEQMVDTEVAGREAAVRALTTWCQCGEVSHDEVSYYARANGRHGFFHDPGKGGCGGITQTG